MSDTIRLTIDLTPEEARWIAGRYESNDRLGAFHTAEDKVTAAAIEALEQAETAKTT